MRIVLPPRPTSAELAHAIARIVARHEAHNDQLRAEMGTEPRDIVDYLQRGSPVTLESWRRQDSLDAPVLHNALRWDEAERERRFLYYAKDAGLTLSEVGTGLGYATRQGV